MVLFMVALVTSCATAATNVWLGDQVRTNSIKPTNYVQLMVQRPGTYGTGSNGLWRLITGADFISSLGLATDTELQNGTNSVKNWAITALGSNQFNTTQFATNGSGKVTIKNGAFLTNTTEYAPYLTYNDGSGYNTVIEPRNNGTWAYNDVTDFWKFDTTNWTFFQSVSGPTPTQPSNLVTKAYADNLTNGLGSAYNPLVNSNFFIIYATGQGTNTLGGGTNILVLCENSSSTNTVILPVSPTKGQEVIVKHWAGSWSHSSVVIDGNGKFIDNFNSLELTNYHESVWLIYSTNASRWFIVSHVNETQTGTGTGATNTFDSNFTLTDGTNVHLAVGGSYSNSWLNIPVTKGNVKFFSSLINFYSDMNVIIPGVLTNFTTYGKMENGKFTYPAIVASGNGVLGESPGLEVTYHASIGGLLQVEGTTNLNDWARLGTNVLGSGGVATNVSTNMVGMTWWNLKDHGAKFDGVLLTNAAWTLNGTNLVCTNATFGTGDVGKLVFIYGADASNTNWTGYIHTYVNIHTVAINRAIIGGASFNEGTGKVVYGSNDQDAWQLAFDQVTNGSVTIYAPNGISVVGGSFSATKNSLIAVPDVGYYGTIVPTLRVVGESAPWSGYTGPGSLAQWTHQGSAIWCVVTGNGTNQTLISSTNVTNPYEMGGDKWNNVRVRFENIGFRLLPNPQMSCLNLSEACTADLFNTYVDTGWVGYTGPAPTCVNSVAVKLPRTNNSGIGINRLDQVNVCGTYVGIDSYEGVWGSQIGIMSGIIGLRLNGSYHAATYTDVIITGNSTNIYVTGANRTTIANFKTEHASDAQWYGTDVDLYDPSNYLKGSISWAVVKAGVGIDSTWTQVGGTNCVVVEMGKSPVVKYAGHYDDGSLSNVFGGSYVALTTNAPSDGQVLTATGSKAKWAVAAGSQTPWTQDVNAAGYALTNLNGLFVTGTNLPASSMGNGEVQLYNSNGVLYAICKDLGGNATTNKLAPP